MKKLFQILILTLVALFFLATPVSATRPQQSIGKTADALIVTGSGYLKSIIVNTDGTNSVTVAAYDNTTATGTKLFSTITVTTSSANRATILSFDPNECLFNIGIYIDITTSGSATYDVYYERK